MVSIHILTALWKRPEITRICFEGIKRLQSYKPDRYRIDITAVGSEKGDNRDLCNEYGINYTYAGNKPLGFKWHSGLQEALKHDFDFLMLLGSDDLISNSLLDLYGPLYDEYYVFGVEDMYCYSGELQKMLYFPGYKQTTMSIGAGRMIHREVIEKCGKKLWPFSINRGLDGSSLTRIRAFGFDEHVINARDKAAIIDIKSRVNINTFDRFRGMDVDADSVLNQFSEKERQLIKGL